MTTNGVIDSTYDIRDYWYSPADWGEPTFDFDIEAVIGHRLTVKDQNGSGSCFHGSTPVLMGDMSYKPISDIHKGDEVITHRGRKGVVQQTFKRKWQGTTTFMSVWGDFAQIEATKEHPFFGIKRPLKNRYITKNGKTSWLKNVDLLVRESPQFYSVKELTPGDWVAYPFNNFVEDKTLHSYERDIEFLWLLGLYIAEGNPTKYGVSLSLHKNELEWFDVIKDIMRRYDANVTYSLKGENGLTIFIQGARWGEIFSELGGKYCDEKRIADRLMQLEPYLQMAIYHGVYDGDGTLHRGSQVIKSTSVTLLRQLKTILLRNRRFSAIAKEKPYDGKKQAYTLSVSEASRYSFAKDGHIFVQIKNMRHSKSYAGGYVYNLEVSVDNSYQVNGIAVHNCGGQAWSYYGEVLEAIATGNYEPRSARWIYSHTAVPGGGSRGKDNSDFVVKNGFVQEKYAPSYNNGKAPDEDFMLKVPELSKEALEDKEVSKALSYLKVTPDFYTVAGAIRENYGCILSIGGENNGTWKGKYPKPPTKRVWGHWCYAGRLKEIRGKKYIGILNSWGTDVGDEGWQWLSEEYFTSGFIREAWTLAWDYEPAKHKLILQKTIKLLQELVEVYKKLKTK